MLFGHIPRGRPRLAPRSFGSVLRWRSDDDAGTNPLDHAADRSLAAEAGDHDNRHAGGERAADLRPRAAASAAATIRAERRSSSIGRDKAVLAMGAPFSGVPVYSSLGTALKITAVAGAPPRLPRPWSWPAPGLAPVETRRGSHVPAAARWPLRRRILVPPTTTDASTPESNEDELRRRLAAVTRRRRAFCATACSIREPQP